MAPPTVWYNKAQNEGLQNYVSTTFQVHMNLLSDQRALCAIPGGLDRDYHNEREESEQEVPQLDLIMFAERRDTRQKHRDQKAKAVIEGGDAGVVSPYRDVRSFEIL